MGTVLGMPYGSKWVPVVLVAWQCLLLGLAIGILLAAIVSVRRHLGAETRTAAMVTPPRTSPWSCEVDLRGTFDFRPDYDSRPVALYHRHTWWAGQCAEGALVEVSPEQLRTWQEEEATMRRLTEEYRVLRAREGH
jgi:hypothetical protein